MAFLEHRLVQISYFLMCHPHDFCHTGDCDCFQCFFRARKHVCDCNSNCRHPDADCSWGFFSTKVGSILSVRVVKCLPRRAATTLGGSFSGPFSSAASLVIFSPHFGPISGALSRGLLNKIVCVALACTACVQMCGWELARWLWTTGPAERVGVSE